jgi:hypothetical protein
MIGEKKPATGDGGNFEKCAAINTTIKESRAHEASFKTEKFRAGRASVTPIL